MTHQSAVDCAHGIPINLACGACDAEAAAPSVTDAILSERGSRYGVFIEQSAISQAIKSAYVQGASWPTMPPDMREALDQIAIKLARIANGDFTHLDSWDDITGYVTLVTNRLRRTAP